MPLPMDQIRVSIRTILDALPETPQEEREDLLDQLSDLVEDLDLVQVKVFVGDKTSSYTSGSDYETRVVAGSEVAARIRDKDLRHRLWSPGKIAISWNSEYQPLRPSFEITEYTAYVGVEADF